jgi:hypothetical protein
LDKSLSLEGQAHQAFNFRNNFRNEARNLMKDRVEAEYLFKTEPNMTWEGIVEKYSNQRLEGDDLWNKIIESSQKSRTSANEASGVAK